MRIDTARGVVEINGCGFWSAAVVDEHFTELAIRVDQLRRTTQMIRVLVDLTEAMVQTAETTERLKYETRRIWRSDDRIATVVRSTLAGMQINRAVDVTNHRTFMNMADAQGWLELI